MAKNAIKGITIEIGGNSVGLQKALGEVNGKAGQLSAEMRQVNNALKFDPTNVTLLAQKQQILSEQVKNVSDKLQQLRSVQSQVEQQFQRGEIGADAYRAFQRELVNTESRLNNLESEQRDVEKATDSASSSTKEFSISLDGAKNVASGFVSATGLIVDGLVSISQTAISAGKDFVNMVDSVGNAGDAIDKSSQAAGMSAEVYQEWGYVLQRNGASADSLSTWMKKLNNNVDDAVSGSDSAIEKFTRMGIAVDDLQNKSREELFSEVVAALQNMENESERAAAVNDLLGGSATDLGALLNATAEDTQALRNNAHQLGLVMSDEAVADSAAYADAMLDLQSAVTGVKNSIAADMLPSFTQALQGLTGLVIGTEGASDDFTKGIENIVSSITDLAPKAGETIGNIVMTVADIAPELVNTATTLINSVATALVDNSSSIALSAGELAVSIADGLTSNTETVLGAVLSIGDNILNALPNILQSLVSSASSFAKSIIDFISKGISIVTQNLPQIISTLSESLSAELPTITRSIFDLITNAVDSVLPILPDILNEIINLAIELIMEFLPQIIDTVVKIAESIVDNLPSIVDTLANAIPDIMHDVLIAVLNQIPKLIEGVFKIVSAITEALPQIIDSLVEMLPEIINAIIIALTIFLPKIVETGITLFTAIIKDLPRIINSIVGKLPEIIDSIINALLDALPLLIDCGVDLFLALIENLPLIIMGIEECIPQIIEGIVKAVTELAPSVVTAGYDLLMSLVNDLPNVIQKLAKRMPEIVTGLTEKLREHIYKMADIGKNLVEGIWEGISDAKDWIIEKIGGWKDSVLEAIRDFFGIHSPSRLFRDEIGKNLALGIGEGFSDTMTDVTKDMKSAMPTSFNIDPSVNLVSGDSRMQIVPQTFGGSIVSDSGNTYSDGGGVSAINFTLRIDNFNNTANTSIDTLSQTIENTLYEFIKRNKLAVR